MKRNDRDKKKKPKKRKPPIDALSEHLPHQSSGSEAHILKGNGLLSLPWQLRTDATILQNPDIQSVGSLSISGLKDSGVESPLIAGIDKTSGNNFAFDSHNTSFIDSKHIITRCAKCKELDCGGGILCFNRELSTYHASTENLPLSLWQHAEASIKNPFLIEAKGWANLHSEKQDEKLVQMEKLYEENMNAVKEDLATTRESLEKTTDKLTRLEWEQEALKRNYEDGLKITREHRNVKKNRKGEEKGGVTFNRATGSIYTDKGKTKIGELEPHSSEYFFFEIMFDEYPLTPGFEQIASYIGKKTCNRSRAATYQGFCYSLKSKIKKKSPKISDIIENYTSGDGNKGCRIIDQRRQESSS